MSFSQTDIGHLARAVTGQPADVARSLLSQWFKVRNLPIEDGWLTDFASNLDMRSYNDSVYVIQHFFQSAGHYPQAVLGTGTAEATTPGFTKSGQPANPSIAILPGFRPLSDEEKTQIAQDREVKRFLEQQSAFVSSDWMGYAAKNLLAGVIAFIACYAGSKIIIAILDLKGRSREMPNQTRWKKAKAAHV